MGLILANPTYVDPTVPEWVRRVRHTELVIDAAAREDVLDMWPWDTPDTRTLTKLYSTPRSATSSWAAKPEAAEAPAKALCITDPSRIRGESIIIYDDVCTTGVQIGPGRPRTEAVRRRGDGRRPGARSAALR